MNEKTIMKHRFQHDPPHLARQFLQWCCAARWIEEVEGDLEEQFRTHVREGHPRRAHLTYWRDVLLFASQPYVRRTARPPYHQARGPLMLTNYLKMALRTLRKRLGYTLINVTGLAIGLACCLLILLYVQHEFRYDRFHAHADRIHQLVNDVRLPSGETRSGYTSARYGPEMAAAFPEIATVARLARPRSSLLFRYEDQYHEEQALLFADSTLFDVFSFRFLAGNPATALDRPFSLVLTESTARKYFGDQDPIGQPLAANTGATYTVTGLLADVPTTSHLRFDGLLSMVTAEQTSMFSFEDLLDLRFATYFLFQDGTHAADLEAKLPGYIEQTIGEVQRQNNFFYTFHLITLADVYLHADHRGLGQRGDRANLYTFIVIALFTLLIACINFMNLATARSVERAREVGVRKVAGARRRQLAGQFLSESVLLSVLGLGVALALGRLLLPFFNTMADTTLTLEILGQPVYLLGLLGGSLGVGVLAGSYPALVLSGFRPSQVLKGHFHTSRRGSTLRKGLVVFQFTITVVLLIGTGIVYQQLRFMQQQRLGFRTEQMLVIDFRNDAQVQQQIDVLKAALGQVPGVTATTASWVVPGARVPAALTHLATADGETHEAMSAVYPVDFDFLSVYDLDVIAGRTFSSAFATDSVAAFIVNEATVRAFGYTSPDDIIGQPFREWGQDGSVIGVVKDFHYTSLREEIEPMNFLIGTQPRYLTLRVAGDDVQSTVAEARQTWQRLVPHRPFDYRFLDETFDAQYRSETQFGRLIGSFTLLAMVVACLGLFGLISFIAQQRTQEIGVRKVLGASVPQIVLLLSKDFTWLVGLAAVLAFPIAYSIMHRWLDDFAYRIEISAWIFLIAGSLALAIAWGTVSYQAVKAALADPVKALRYE